MCGKSIERKQVMCKRNAIKGYKKRPMSTDNKKSINSVKKKVACSKKKMTHLKNQRPMIHFNELQMECDEPKLQGCSKKVPTLESDSYSDSDKVKKCDKSDSLVTKHYDLMNLLHSQNFIGYWENLGELIEMLGLNVFTINGVDVTNNKIANKCVATILALAALHVISMDQKNLWTMIEMKAIDWLKSTLPNADINQLIKDTESLINK